MAAAPPPVIYPCKGLLARNLSGMPASHAACFQRVADETGCVISSRSVGPYVTGLLLENYATKGFHNKAKTCNWGPMAGFVLSDPRFTKRGGSREARETQRTDLSKAFDSGAGETPLFITDERRTALETMRCIRRSGGNINEMQYTAASPSGEESLFILRRAFDAPGAEGKQLWAVLYGPREVRLPSSLTAPVRPQGNELFPVMAMVDPDCPALVRRTYRAATTGDYDLFAVFPRRYAPAGADRRSVPGSDRFRVPKGAFAAHEDADLGNITPRIRRIKDLLNVRIRSEAGYRGGDCVHHSDEAGRPGVSSIEFPVIAFVPRHQEPYGIANLRDVRQFLLLLGFEYYVTFNPGWDRQRGISVTPGGSYEV
ncbi:MAG: CyaA/EF/ExoY family adenylyl cyclase toxin [Acidobacteriia bacterium]|nr:CyaA/EF/ExoY family adenylyl cyclase toxin [Terriglobia bacterium]